MDPVVRNIAEMKIKFADAHVWRIGPVRKQQSRSTAVADKKKESE
jgi:hypothetical protein